MPEKKEHGKPFGYSFTGDLNTPFVADRREVDRDRFEKLKVSVQEYWRAFKLDPKSLGFVEAALMTAYAMGLNDSLGNIMRVFKGICEEKEKKQE